MSSSGGGLRAAAAARAAEEEGPLRMPRMIHPENAEVDAWLAKEEPEEVIEPELPIIDAHHHLWDRRTPAPWFTYRTKHYGAADFAHEIAIGGHNVVGTVFVQSGSFHLSQGPGEYQACGEVEYCQGVAARCDSGVYEGAPRLCQAIQGYVDLKHENAPAVLARMAAARNFRGIRGTTPFNDDFKRGFAALGERGLVFDRWPGSPAELPELAALAREFPTVPMVLNHLCGTVGPKLAAAAAPGSAAGGDADANAGAGADADAAANLAAWKDGVEAVAQCPNVYAKIGGFAMVACGHGLESRAVPIGSTELADLAFPYVEHVVKAFGASRCMCESNFPVERDCVSYRTLWNAIKKMAAKLGLTDAEKADMFHNTAVRVYGLRDVTGVAGAGADDAAAAQPPPLTPADCDDLAAKWGPAFTKLGLGDGAADFRALFAAAGVVITMPGGEQRTVAGEQGFEDFGAVLQAQLAAVKYAKTEATSRGVQGNKMILEYRRFNTAGENYHTGCALATVEGGLITDLQVYS